MPASLDVALPRELRDRVFEWLAQGSIEGDPEDVLLALTLSKSLHLSALAALRRHVFLPIGPRMLQYAETIRRTPAVGEASRSLALYVPDVPHLQITSIELRGIVRIIRACPQLRTLSVGVLSVDILGAINSSCIYLRDLYLSDNDRLAHSFLVNTLPLPVYRGLRHFGAACHPDDAGQMLGDLESVVLNLEGIGQCHQHGEPVDHNGYTKLIATCAVERLSLTYDLDEGAKAHLLSVLGDPMIGSRLVVLDIRMIYNVDDGDIDWRNVTPQLRVLRFINENPWSLTSMLDCLPASLRALFLFISHLDYDFDSGDARTETETDRASSVDEPLRAFMEGYNESRSPSASSSASLESNYKPLRQGSDHASDADEVEYEPGRPIDGDDEVVEEDEEREEAAPLDVDQSLYPERCRWTATPPKQPWRDQIVQLVRSTEAALPHLMTLTLSSDDYDFRNEVIRWATRPELVWLRYEEPLDEQTAFWLA